MTLIARIQQEPEVVMYFNVHVRGSYVVDEGQLKEETPDPCSGNRYH